MLTLFFRCSQDRLIRMYSNVDIYVKEGARFLLFLILLLSAYTYRRNVSEEYVKSLLYMLVVLVVYLSVPTTLWKYMLV